MEGATMSVRVFLADETDLMRRALRLFLRHRKDIKIVGEASSLPETIEKTTELHPDVVVLDLSMPDKNHVPLAEIRALLNHTKIIAIAFGIDALAAELAENLGAAKLLDEMELARELVPAILALAPS
jgi:DNA-binding NarL/FixJ family response regulator